MRIVCPACAATYEVPDAMLAPAGRVVRCARCGREWHPSPAPPTAAPPPAVATSTARRDASTPPRQAPLAAAARLGTATADPSEVGARGRVGLDAAGLAGTRVALAGWIVTALLLASGLLAAYRWRPQVEAAWPPVRRLYAWFGLG